MTYQKTARRSLRRRKQPALSGWLDDIISGAYNVFVPDPAVASDSTTSDCLARANAAVAPMDVKISDLAQTWNPTGIYTTLDLRSIIQATMGAVQQGQAALDHARQEPNASRDSIMRAVDDLARAGQRSFEYLDAAREADQQSMNVDAAGFKKWVLDTLAAASSAMVTASVIGCITPWWVDALATFQIAFDAAMAASRRVAGVALAIGETALKVVEDLPNLYDIVKWGALAAGAYYVWTRYLKER